MVPATIIYFVLILFISSIDSRLHDSVGCNSEEFSCKNGQCILKLSWCDGIEDCKDFSDEDYCLTDFYPDPNQCSQDPDFFICDDGRCIPNEGLCDGLESCLDGSDEKNCHKNESVANETELERSRVESTWEEVLSYERRESNDQLNQHDVAVDYSRENYFSDLHYDNKRNLDSARNWLLSQWNENTGWGVETPRAIIALHLSNADYFNNTEQKMMMMKQLDVQILVALKRNSSQILTVCEMSHYINALTAACRNPRNFNGIDLVSALRERVDSLYYQRIFVSPYVYLTLCTNNFMKKEDILSMQNIVQRRLSVDDKFDMLSLSVLAVSCALKMRTFANPNYITDILYLLIEKIDASGTPRNVYELSLVYQALTEARVDPARWNRTEAIDFILASQSESGSFGDLLATYYAMPILSGRSMLSISTHCQTNLSKAQQTDLKQPKINIGYSLYFGNSVKMSIEIRLQVAEGSNFLDIMHLAKEESPHFKFKLDDTKDFPFVYSIGGIPNDAERGIYWTLYVKSSLNKSELIRLNKDIRNHIPKDNEESVFWLRTI